MSDLASFLFSGLAPHVALFLAVVSFFTSFITVALGIGGGTLLLAVLASLMPPAALIPVHGVIQLGSNFFRGLMFFAHAHWKVTAIFGIGAALGVALGGSISVSLPPAVVQLGVGLFVIWSVFSKPPRWMTRLPALNGFIAAFLAMFFGATAVFVANFVKSLQLPRQEHVATQAVMMTLQHLLKALAFGTLGFAYGPWIGFMALMIAAGLLGTFTGKLLLARMSDRSFRRALDIVLLVISARLIWSAGRSLLGV
ncbi:sulfite exporter TauE/SafE family protein [Pseudooceanicola sp. CBS1P-1]|uniref:Probable membrane transporter protein n=1 Tax=Pseudooceanicola albus TaxID=2692189 RepID=A0A6L7G7G0_9RHOB|nr:MULTISPECIES: sulfite exporter TauE/SafE family protein [Pseudooceanicola]MBT9385789.1 sulfite exporter TauE/SafE family protein [Pseudooceanicola endophyticus]MXN20021.1 TSUP family transporter [Pseudooceanicola albus]